ncbi:LytR/AlgR family response regulator transcription factor [Caldifermentibacillus hisashii]|uniref:LytR/AlgR family response regulator transcription factor n=1 Tax=Caldifermentibacillus hisashii TaxID=996558 RepID=UPI0034D6A2A4
MIRIAIVEDDHHCQEQLINFLHRFKEERDETISIHTYADGDEILENYHAQYDIVLMDIQMKFMDGMSAAEEIRKRDSQVVIIFITNLSQYAIKGYAVDALDYILKPISYFQFSQRLIRAIERMKKREVQFMTVRMKGGVRRFQVSDIYYIESFGHQLIFYTKDGEFSTSGTMKELEKKLADFHFFRGNKGYLINLAHVEGMNDHCAIVKGKDLLISRPRRKMFMEALAVYWGEVIK